MEVECCLASDLNVYFVTTGSTELLSPAIQNTAFPPSAVRSFQLERTPLISSFWGTRN